MHLLLIVSTQFSLNLGDLWQANLDVALLRVPAQSGEQGMSMRRKRDTARWARASR